MTRLLLLLAAAGAAAWALFGKSSSASNKPTSVTVPPEIPPVLPEQSPTLTTAEQTALNTFTNDELYAQAMQSSHVAYITAIASRLASTADPRATEVAARVAQVLPGFKP